jgi:WD40 repeat protein
MLKKIIILIFLSIIFIDYTIAQDGNTIKFPRVSGPIQITENSKEHLFASYYGINSWSKDERYVTVLETDVKFKVPDENDTAVLGLVDIQSKKFIPLTHTRAWNLQQGCMAHWLATNPDSLIIFNDLRNGKYVSVILNIYTRKEIKIIPYPIAAVSPNGKEAISINFARMHITRVDYGYAGNGQDPKINISLPGDDGIFLVDLETGKAKLIVSYLQIKNLVPDLPKEGLEYINHVLFNKNGSKIFWLARATPELNTISLTANKDGTNIQRCFPDGWGGSHFDWLNNNELMITAQFDAKQYAHILFTVGEKNYKRLGNGLLDYDGHGTFSPDGRWLVTDTYPGAGLGEQKIYLMDMKTEAVLPLGRYKEPPEFSKGWRCDIHCRWSPKADMIGFNSTHNGNRQVYIMKVGK